MTASAPSAPLITVNGLEVAFHAGASSVRAVRDVSFAIGKSEVVALVGESGSGKSTTGLALLGLHPPAKATVNGAIGVRCKDGSDLDVVGAPERRLRRLRGNDIAMIFQEPMSSLNPVHRIGDQIVEALRVHQSMPRSNAWTRALRLLTELGVPSPEKCLVSYPHQLSGGMRQRVMIAMALSSEPALLIADEPTTALDVTVQAQIVDLLRALQQRTHMAMLFVSHDLGLVSQVASRVLVMYAGEIVEEGPLPDVFLRPRMPYTRALMRSRAELGATRRRIEPIPGNVPNLARLPRGCAFHPRCPHSVPGLCDVKPPPLERAGDRWSVRCHRWREVEATET
ncbi:MAG TPA: ABC transporter ATP-binding protein [Stellaceae bacterium]|nr:ABC transporter ATP-binding protein [Stellaceae bacterium]